jgi:DNA modification methylase
VSVSYADFLARKRSLAGDAGFETDVLNASIARDQADERHIAPLQLGVIERAVKLWSNPGDLVFSPFAGIGSEGVGALRNGRRFVGTELKPSYFETACRNLTAAGGQLSLFAETVTA